MKEIDVPKFVDLINGDYHDDEDALRGYIWDMLEGYEVHG